MSDILSQFGSDTPQPQVARASNGGKQTPKPIPYSPPKAQVPMKKGPGLGGTNHGNCGSQGKR